MVTIGSVIRAIRDNVPEKKEENVAAAREAYSKVHRVV
jgi:Pyruvate/2-oxoacid:ferredoxin oxidoreductase gamma subunit